MTLTDNLLDDMAKTLNGETYTKPSHVAWSSTAITVDPTDTTLSGEFGDRTTITSARTNNEVTFSGVRTGASVASSTGERLNSMGLFNSSASGTLHAEALVTSVLHTSDFDVELDWVIKVNRRI